MVANTADLKTNFLTVLKLANMKKDTQPGPAGPPNNSTLSEFIFKIIHHDS